MEVKHAESKDPLGFAWSKTNITEISPNRLAFVDNRDRE